MSERLDVPELWAGMERAGHQWPHPVWLAACYESNARDLEAQLAAALEQDRPLHSVRVLVDAIQGERVKAASCLIGWSESASGSEGVRRAA